MVTMQHTWYQNVVLAQSTMAGPLKVFVAGLALHARRNKNHQKLRFLHPAGNRYIASLDTDRLFQAHLEVSSSNFV